LIALGLVAGIAAAVWQPQPSGALGSYATSLQGRTRSQRRNARLAAQQVDGAVIPAGQEWSFNKTVGPWTPDRGYVIAPVSYDGNLVSDWGGGVCQTSTTLYNAALLAGLQIVERHRHTWSPIYAPPGRDAAVAQWQTDLRLKNPYPWPVRIHALAGGKSVGFQFLGNAVGPMAQVRGESQATVMPAEVVRYSARLVRGQRRLMVHGRPGVRVAVYRTFLQGSRSGVRELVSQDSYPAMNRVSAVGSG
jgi:vancomycin resistance protein YoaR